MKFLKYLLLAAFVSAPVALQAVDTKKVVGDVAGVVQLAAGVVGKVAGIVSDSLK